MATMIQNTVLAVWVLSAGMVAGCATQEDVHILNRRIAYLEQTNQEYREKNVNLSQRLESFQKKGTASDQTLRGQSAEIRALMDQLDEEIRTVKGKMEEIDYSVQRRLEGYATSGRDIDVRLSAIEKLIKQNQDRLNQLEQSRSRAPSADKTAQSTSPSKAAVAPQAQSRTPNDSDLYVSGKQAFDRGEYPKARESFERLLSEYPQSKNADNAQFWLGETYYRENWYEKAILEYQKVIEKYPKGNKVPAALLKQGMAFDSLGDKANARIVLQKLLETYPQTNEAKVARQTLRGL